VVSPIRDPAEIDRAVVAVSSEPNGGLIVNPDAFTTANRGLIISLAAVPFSGSVCLQVLRGRWRIALLWA
jgi:hypothetical protein